MKKILSVVLILALLYGLSSMFNNSNKQKKGTTNIAVSTTNRSEKQNNVSAKIRDEDDRGKTITNSDGVALTVLDVKQTKGSESFPAEDGNVFVLIELQIENNTSSEISINSTFGFSAICDDYNVDYSMSADINTKNSLSTTDLKSGRKIKGWKGFEIPENWKELIVTFTPDVYIFSSGEEIEFVIFNH